MRVAQALAFLLASTLIAAPVGQTGAAAPTRTFSLYLLGHRIGQETRTETATDAGRRLAFDFKYNDRGTEVALTSSLELGRDGSPRHFVTKGKTYRYFNADSEVTVTGTRVQVRDGATTSVIDAGGKPFFPLDTFAPIGVHEALVESWLANGRPAELLTAPAGPLRFRSHGVRVMAVGEGDYQFKLERLSIEGAVWGTETVFITAAGPRMADEITGPRPPTAGDIYGLFSWTGGLAFGAVAYTNEFHYERMSQIAVADRIADWLRRSREIRAVRTGSYALVGATVIDGTNRPPIPNATIVVRDGKIAAVGPAARTPVPSGVQTVEANGQFIIPGLWDMHAHVSQIDWFPAYLASGVTTIRDMGGEFGFLKASKDALGSAGALGPRLFAAGLIDGRGPRAFGHVSVSTPDEARAAVRKYHEAGFEQIKVYLAVPQALVPVIAEEAHQLGMTVTGHIATGMTTQSVLDAGFDSLAHMQIRGQPGSPEAAATIALFKKYDTVMDPTLSWSEFLSQPRSDAASAIHPDIDRLPPRSSVARSDAALDY